MLGLKDTDDNNDPVIFSDVHLQKILTLFFSKDETLRLISELKTSLNDTRDKEPLEETISLILELLTEPRYMLGLEKKKRALLQAKLIEMLNELKAKVERLSSSGAKSTEKKVLIVEDSLAMVELLKDIFREANYRVVANVDNGQDAIDKYKFLNENNERPDIVLMDIFLKGLDGVEATRSIRNYDPDSNIVVLTSTLDNKIRRTMRSLDVYDYLIKPVTKMQLLSCVEQSIAKHRG
jgi:CheY-like chemotaxis protein